MSIPNKVMELANYISGSLARMLGPDARFALVVWQDGDETPLFSTSNEAQMEIPREMLKASARMISDVELYADHGGNVGHA